MAANEDARPLDIAPEARAARIASLNDQFRRGRSPGRVMLTAGIQALEPEAIFAIVAAVEAFDTFTEDNDPHGEHDFGSLEHDGQRVFWKIDCYDRNLEYGSPDPTDPAATIRVLTLMLASEY